MIEAWVIYAFLALIGYCFVNFLLKLVASGNPLVVSFVLYGAGAICMLGILAFKPEFSLSPRSIIIAVAIGIASAVATTLGIKSIHLAPNPGYSVAIYSSSFVFLTIISVFAFGSPLTFKKFLGILAVLFGLILLSV